MVQASYTEAQMQAAYALVREHGSVSAAARASGAARGTVHNHYHAALSRLGMAPVTPAATMLAPKAFQAPVIPGADVPIDEWLERRELEFARRQDRAAAMHWMRFQVREPGPFGLAFVGDPHIDDDGCDLPTLRRHLDLIEATPALYGVGMGDWTNAWVGKLSRLYGQQGTTETQAWRAAEWLLSRPVWMLILLGNHDMWHGSGSPLRWMQTRAPVVDWQARFRVADASGVAEWRIHAAHDFKGSSIWNALHGPGRQAQLTGVEADLFIAGHRHTWGLHEDQCAHTGRRYWAARARGYKALDGFADRHGFGQQQDRGQTIAALCDPETRAMHCVSDLEEATHMLAWMRARRGFKARASVRAET